MNNKRERNDDNLPEAGVDPVFREQVAKMYKLYFPNGEQPVAVPAAVPAIVPAAASVKTGLAGIHLNDGGNVEGQKCKVYALKRFQTVDWYEHEVWIITISGKRWFVMASILNLPDDSTAIQFVHSKGKEHNGLVEVKLPRKSPEHAIIYRITEIGERKDIILVDVDNSVWSGFLRFDPPGTVETNIMKSKSCQE